MENSLNLQGLIAKERYVKQQLNVLDLFCGAGGLSCGFEQAGFNIILGIDNDAAALDTFQYNHKDSQILCSDITQISYKDIKESIGNKQIDVIIGGPPCQGFSLSGPRNFNDPRNKLYLSFIRLVEEIKPGAFVIENVPGLVSLFGGEVKNNIVKSFADMGYRVAYKILCAADYGVPQNRKRVIFVGILNGNKDFDYPKAENNIVTCEMALSDLPPLTESLGEELQDLLVTDGDACCTQFSNQNVRYGFRMNQGQIQCWGGESWQGLGDNPYRDDDTFRVRCVRDVE